MKNELTINVSIVMNKKDSNEKTSKYVDNQNYDTEIHLSKKESFSIEQEVNKLYSFRPHHFDKVYIC